MEELLNLLNLESKETKIIGIWGMGGIGKTTIAKAIFNQICSNFEESIFLNDIIEASKQHNGLVGLQKHLLGKEIQLISNINEGKYRIKERLSKKKVLIVLDNVDDIKHLEALAAHSNWFGQGSKILITTRDKEVLNGRVDKPYEVKELNYVDSLYLFSRHAFGNDKPPGDLLKLVHNVVDIAGGLPLVLEVLGSSLSGERDPEAWRSTLDRLKKVPDRKVLETLKITYDGLVDFDKAIFLDIACFFIGVDREHVVDILEGCSFFSKIGIINLIKKSLIKICQNKLRMHDLLRDMGRHIVCRESPNEPGMRSRLWSQDEVLNVLDKQEGTRRIEGFVLKFENENASKGIRFKTKAFEGMAKLRLLQIDNVQLEGDFKKFPAGLRWLSWKGCPLKYIPKDFPLEKLVVLDLSNSRIKKAWTQNKQFQKLKVLLLSGCRHLTKTPDFSRLPKLEKLNLDGCMKLKELQSSICTLKSLKNLNLSGCSKLKELPDLHESLKELKLLNLSWCQHLTKTPDFSRVPNLKTLNLEGCRELRELPFSICNLKSLKELILSGCSNLNNVAELVGSLKDLEVMKLDGCKLLCRAPESIRKMTNLKRLSLEGTSITELPDAVGSLEKMEELNVRYCKKLVRLSNSMGKMSLLNKFYIDETGIVKLPEDFGMLSSLCVLSMYNCREFRGFPENFGSLIRLSTLDVKGNSKLTTLPKSFSDLCSLSLLQARRCNLSEGGIPSDIGKLSSLKFLDLSYNNFCSLPSSISNLPHLFHLALRNCRNLECLPQMPSSLHSLDVGNCISLEHLSDLSHLKLLGLYISNCKKLANIQGLEELGSLSQTDGCSKALLKSMGQTPFLTITYWTFSGSEIPSGFTPMKIRDDFPPSLDFIGELEYKIEGDCEEVRSHNNSIGFLLCFVFTSPPVQSHFSLLVNIKRNGRVLGPGYTTAIYNTENDQDKTCLCYFHEDEPIVRSLEEGDGIFFRICTEYKMEVKKAGVHWNYQETVGSRFKMYLDLIGRLSHDDVVGEGEGSASSSMKRTMVQLLDQ